MHVDDLFLLLCCKTIKILKQFNAINFMEELIFIFIKRCVCIMSFNKYDINRRRMSTLFHS